MPTTTSETATYSAVQIASEPRIPRGMSRLGSRVSSAAVATMSKPMKAKNTMAAPASTPPQPNVPGLNPVITEISGVCSNPPSPAAAGSAGGTNGGKVGARVQKKPTNDTNQTTDRMSAAKDAGEAEGVG